MGLFTSKAAALQQKFIQMGTLQGKSFDAIQQAVGPPSSISQAGANILKQWMAIGPGGGYHIALLFDQNDVCLGVSHESRT